MAGMCRVKLPRAYPGPARAREVAKTHGGGQRDMAWTWRFEKMDGTPATARDLPKETFASQSDAETWLGESWRGLLEAGVDQVTLLEEARTEYGPMSLHPED